jgi:squalene-associated FAD-dependent desaturase
VDRDDAHRPVVSPVVIVGGGLSGLAAAVDLCAAGVPVLLLEQKPVGGGRACSYTDPTTGDTIDNGQHLLIAGYERTFAYLDRIGARHLTVTQGRPVLPFHHPDRGFVEFRLPALPAPLHLLWGIATTPLLNLPDRIRLLRAGRALRRSGTASGNTITRWLDAQHQSAEARRCFWEPLAVAIMNEQMDRAPASLFLRTLRTAFLDHWSRSALVFPRAGLSAVFVDPACAFIERHGGAVRCAADVISLETDGALVRSVTLKGGEHISCSAVILAVPPARLVNLWPVGIPLPGNIDRMVPTAASPIISIHLWFERPFMDQDVLGLIGRRVHWIFRKQRHLSATISAAYTLVGLSNEELVKITVEDLRTVFGGAVGVPVHAVVIREKRATFSATPENEGSRPGPMTAAKNLFLAGDWTDTGLPATIEGAIQSGQTCARLIVGGK